MKLIGMSKITQPQFGLFQGPENIKVADADLAELDEIKEIEKLSKLPRGRTQLFKETTFSLKTRISILRGFIELHFREDPEKVMNRPLQILGGRTLNSFLVSNWPHAYAWTQEYRLHPEEKHLLIAPFIAPIPEKKK